MSVELWGAEPPRDCPLCPRLVAYRQANAELVLRQNLTAG